MTGNHDKTPSTDVAVLVGNGLSIAFNPKLTIPSITEEIVTRLDEAGEADDQASVLMQEVAQRVRIENADRNFEELVAPFDEIVDVTRMMDRLAGIAGDKKLTVQKSLRDSSQFASEVRRHAVSHILEVIAARSRARQHLIGGVDKFISAVVDSANGGQVTFGNLNYDSLAMAALCNLYEHRMCDLTDGRHGPRDIEVVPDWPMPGRPLRNTGNMPMNRKITLLHLHGSLTWLHNPKSNTYYRFRIEDLRDSEYWTAWREDKTEWEPVVVLTNQNSKNALVKEYPFLLAYKTFEQRLMAADRWLIAGLSLGDDCLNEVLRRVWARRETLPSVLVVTKGAWPTEKHILDSIGYDPVWGGDPDPSKWLQVHRDGIETAPGSWEWLAWQSNNALYRAPWASWPGRTAYTSAGSAQKES